MSARPSLRCAGHSWSSCSPAACSSCSWPRAAVGRPFSGPPFRGHPERSAKLRPAADKPKWLAAGICRNVGRQPAEEPGLLRLSPVASCSSIRMRSWLPTSSLPAGQDRHRQGRCAAADIPGRARPGLGRRCRLLLGGKVSDRRWPAWKIFVLTATVVYGLALFGHRRRHQLQRFPGRHGMNTAGLASACTLRSTWHWWWMCCPTGRARQGPRRVQCRLLRFPFPSRRRSRRPSW